MQENAPRFVPTSTSGIVRACSKPCVIPERMECKTGQHTQMMGYTGEGHRQER